MIGAKTETDRRYMTISLPADGEQILHAVRMLRCIENGLHCCLDMTSGEDACPIRLRNAAPNVPFLRRAAKNLFRADQSRSISLPKNARLRPGMQTTSPISFSFICGKFDAPALTLALDTLTMLE
ncbi:hypothetical protein [Verminephrobacter eiseniae]|uniref:hypothetical protein n=1 Tax=Verminephrobacter eiseniae TaxID=364317 RepID=UPI002237BFE4|nr:hypothetical protein [Verminephrobacter eiseniae]